MDLFEGEQPITVLIHVVVHVLEQLVLVDILQARVALTDKSAVKVDRQVGVEFSSV